MKTENHIEENIEIVDRLFRKQYGCGQNRKKSVELSNKV
jgi:hypothetical protein